MTPLQSWLLLIAVVAVVTVAIFVLWTIIETLILYAIEVRRVRRATLARQDNATQRWRSQHSKNGKGPQS